MEYHLFNINEDIVDLKHKLTHFCMNTIKWSCLFSGMGIIQPLSQNDIDHILKIESPGKHNKNLIVDFAPIKCIYEKGLPSFSISPPEIKNPGRYMWNFPSFEKNIPISAQAFAILSLCISSEQLYKTDVVEGYLMVKTARTFYNFISTYLRNDDGLFVSGKDKTKYFDEDLNIKLDQKDVKMIDQIFVFEAALYLYKITSSSTMKEYHYSKSQNYSDEALSLFKYIYDSYNLLLDLNTKDIALCVSSLTRCFSITDNTDLKENLMFLISQLCGELEARIKITGEIEQGCDEHGAASVSTHFRVISALIEGCLNTKIDKFSDQALRIYNSLQDLYEPTIGLFVHGDYKVITYSIRDVSEIIKCLFLVNNLLNDKQSIFLLKEFYNLCIENSGIVQSIVKNTFEVDNISIVLDGKIPIMEEVEKAPVFLKNFKITFNKKNTIHEASKYFNSCYGLYASYMLIYYLNFPCEINN